MVLRLLGSTRGRLHGDGAGLLLLHKQVVDLGDVLVEEVRVSDELLELKDTVKEATGNLTGHLSMHILDREVDGVTNELNLFGSVGDSVKLGEVNFGEADLLHSGLLGSRGLLASHGREVSVVVNDRLLGSLASALSLAVLVSTSTSNLTSSVLLVLATTSTSALVVTSGVVLSLLVTLILLHSVHSLHHVLLLRSLVLAVSEPVEHFSLFTSMLLVFKFLLGDPEVNRDGFVAEGSSLVKALNSELSMVDVFVENESLFVGRSLDMGVSSELDGHNRGDSFVKGSSVDVEVSDLTSFREGDPKVLRVGGGEGVDGGSSLEGHGSSVTVFARGVALSDAYVSCMGLASDSHLLDSGGVIELDNEISGEMGFIVGSHQVLEVLVSGSSLLSRRSN